MGVVIVLPRFNCDKTYRPLRQHPVRLKSVHFGILIRYNMNAAGSTMSPTVHQLRRRWKPHKERLAAVRGDHPTNIRFHRACSWLQRLEELDGDADLDLVLTGQWIAFNALYGQWDEKRCEPLADRECWRRFLDRVRGLDADGLIGELLMDHKRLVMAILDDSHLGSFFWKAPSTQLALRTTHDRRDANTWYQQKQWGLILEKTADQIYLLRCQMLHGASTYNSRLNRSSVRRCSQFMAHLLGVSMTVWIDHGSDEDWGTMCYPPSG